MPQNNPVSELGRSATIFNDRFDQSNLIQSATDVNIWYRIKVITVPVNFTSVLFVNYIFSFDAVLLRFGIQQEFQPNTFTTPIVTLTSVATGPIGSPVVSTNGYGPAFERRTQAGAAIGNLTGLGVNVPLVNTGGASNVFEDIPLMFPIRATTLVTGAGGVRPNDVDIILHWNFWR